MTPRKFYNVTGEGAGGWEAKDFKLIGLNKRGPVTGIYATVEIGKEDWFHAEFDTGVWPLDRQLAFWEFMIEPEQKFKGAIVVVRFDGYSTSEMPINPRIIEVKNLPPLKTS